MAATDTFKSFLVPGRGLSAVTQSQPPTCYRAGAGATAPVFGSS
ncbi:MAG: hypothetical protein ACK4QP_09840 [Pseudorhizobium sp.]